MSDILTDMYTLTSFSSYDATRVVDYDFNRYSDVYAIIENLVICNKLMVGQRGAKTLNLSRFCQDFHDIIKYVADTKLYSDDQDVSYIGAYKMDISSRGVLYADLAKEIGCYYTPHPTREPFLVENISLYLERTSKIVLDKFDQKLCETSAGMTSNLNIKIPPVVEHVLSFSKKNELSISQSIREIRESKNAQTFRAYFNKLDSELRDLSPRKKIRVFQPLFRDIDKICNVWVEDLDNGVKYRQRKIKLSKLPIIGKLFEPFGLEHIDYEDPILWPDKPHFLFVNDLYR